MKDSATRRMALSETHSEAVTSVFPITEVLAAGRTKFQSFEIVISPMYGKMLWLDGKTQSSQLDEYVYHECIVHPGLLLHNSPRRVCVIGGGEGATLREVLRHMSVEEAIMVDVDQELVEVSKRLLPEFHQGAFDDPRTHFICSDGRRWLEEQPSNSIDVLIIDLNDPVDGGPAIFLFTKEFYGIAHRVLSDGGIVIMGAGSAGLTHSEGLASCVKSVEESFPFVRVLTCPVETYLGQWAFVVATKKIDPLGLSQAEIRRRLIERSIQNRYYTARVHEALFTIPDYLLSAIEQNGRVITDSAPFVWNA